MRGLDRACKDSHKLINSRDEIVRITSMGNYDMIVVVAAAYGNLEIIKIYSEKTRICDCMDNMLSVAAANGHRHIFKYLYKTASIKNCNMTDHLCMAAKAGHLNVVEWICKKIKNAKSIRAFKDACRFNRLEIAKFLQNMRMDYCRQGLDVAIKNKNIDIIQWLMPIIDKNDLADCTDSICEPYDEEFFKKIIDLVPKTHRKSFADNVSKSLIENGNIAGLEILCSNFKVAKQKLVDVACVKDNRIIIEWIIREWPDKININKTFYKICEYCGIQTIAWFYETYNIDINVVWKKAMNIAQRNEDFELFRWLILLGVKYTIDDKEIILDDDEEDDESTNKNAKKRKNIKKKSSSKNRAISDSDDE